MTQPKLLDQVRTVLRVKHFSLSTEKAYVAWIRRFILYHQKRHPKYMGEDEIRKFISHLAVDAKISASTPRRQKSFGPMESVPRVTIKCEITLHVLAASGTGVELRKRRSRNNKQPLDDESERDIE